MKLILKNYGGTSFQLYTPSEFKIVRIVHSENKDFYYFNRYRKGFLITLTDSASSNDVRVTKENSAQTFYKLPC